MDPPQHTTTLIGAGEIDFVAACSARLPMLTIMEMLGVPAADQPEVAKAAENLFSMSDDEYSTLEERAQDTINEIMLLSSMGAELAKFRRDHPVDDLMTSIVNAEVGGHRLTDEEIGAFLILLSSAGNDTTKQTTTHAMMRWSIIRPNAIGSSKISRIASASQSRSSCAGRHRSCSSRVSQRSTPRSTGKLQRSPNPRLGFGGGSPHFCLGNQLARTELRNLFRELLTRLQRIDLGEPDLVYSSFVHGVKRLPAFVR